MAASSSVPTLRRKWQGLPSAPQHESADQGRQKVLGYQDDRLSGVQDHHCRRRSKGSSAATSQQADVSCMPPTPPSHGLSGQARRSQSADTKGRECRNSCFALTKPSTSQQLLVQGKAMLLLEPSQRKPQRSRASSVDSTRYRHHQTAGSKDHTQNADWSSKQQAAQQLLQDARANAVVVDWDNFFCRPDTPDSPAKSDQLWALLATIQPKFAVQKPDNYIPHTPSSLAASSYQRSPLSSFPGSPSPRSSCASPRSAYKQAMRAAYHDQQPPLLPSPSPRASSEHLSQDAAVPHNTDNSSVNWVPLLDVQAPVTSNTALADTIRSPIPRQQVPHHRFTEAALPSQPPADITQLPFSPETNLDSQLRHPSTSSRYKDSAPQQLQVSMLSLSPVYAPADPHPTTHQPSPVLLTPSRADPALHSSLHLSPCPSASSLGQHTVTPDCVACTPRSSDSGSSCASYSTSRRLTADYSSSSLPSHMHTEPTNQGSTPYPRLSPEPADFNSPAQVSHSVPSSTDTAGVNSSITNPTSLVHNGVASSLPKLPRLRTLPRNAAPLQPAVSAVQTPQPPFPQPAISRLPILPPTSPRSPASKLTTGRVGTPKALQGATSSTRTLQPCSSTPHLSSASPAPATVASAQASVTTPAQMQELQKLMRKSLGRRASSPPLYAPPEDINQPPPPAASRRGHSAPLHSSQRFSRPLPVIASIISVSAGQPCLLSRTDSGSSAGSLQWEPQTVRPVSAQYLSSSLSKHLAKRTSVTGELSFRLPDSQLQKSSKSTEQPQLSIREQPAEPSISAAKQSDSAMTAAESVSATRHRCLHSMPLSSTAAPAVSPAVSQLTGNPSVTASSHIMFSNAVFDLPESPMHSGSPPQTSGSPHSVGSQNFTFGQSGCSTACTPAMFPSSPEKPAHTAKVACADQPTAVIVNVTSVELASAEAGGLEAEQKVAASPAVSPELPAKPVESVARIQVTLPATERQTLALDTQPRCSLPCKPKQAENRTALLSHAHTPKQLAQDLATCGGPCNAPQQVSPDAAPQDPHSAVVSKHAGSTARHRVSPSSSVSGTLARTGSDYSGHAGTETSAHIATDSSAHAGTDRSYDLASPVLSNATSREKPHKHLAVSAPLDTASHKPGSVGTPSALMAPAQGATSHGRHSQAAVVLAQEGAPSPSSGSKAAPARKQRRNWFYSSAVRALHMRSPKTPKWLRKARDANPSLRSPVLSAAQTPTASRVHSFLSPRMDMQAQPAPACHALAQEAGASALLRAVLPAAIPADLQHAVQAAPSHASHASSEVSATAAPKGQPSGAAVQSAAWQHPRAYAAVGNKPVTAASSAPSRKAAGPVQPALQRPTPQTASREMQAGGATDGVAVSAAFTLKAKPISAKQAGDPAGQPIFRPGQALLPPAASQLLASNMGIAHHAEEPAVKLTDSAPEQRNVTIKQRKAGPACNPAPTTTVSSTLTDAREALALTQASPPVPSRVLQSPLRAHPPVKPQASPAVRRSAAQNAANGAHAARDRAAPPSITAATARTASSNKATAAPPLRFPSHSSQPQKSVLDHLVRGPAAARLLSIPIKPPMSSPVEAPAQQPGRSSPVRRNLIDSFNSSDEEHHQAVQQAVDSRIHTGKPGDNELHAQGPQPPAMPHAAIYSPRSRLATMKLKEMRARVHAVQLNLKQSPQVQASRDARRATSIAAEAPVAEPSAHGATNVSTDASCSSNAIGMQRASANAAAATAPKAAHVTAVSATASGRNVTAPPDNHATPHAQPPKPTTNSPAHSTPEHPASTAAHSPRAHTAAASGSPRASPRGSRRLPQGSPKIRSPIAKSPRMSGSHRPVPPPVARSPRYMRNAARARKLAGIMRLCDQQAAGVPAGAAPANV